MFALATILPALALLHAPTMAPQLRSSSSSRMAATTRMSVDAPVLGNALEPVPTPLRLRLEKRWRKAVIGALRLAMVERTPLNAAWILDGMPPM